MAIEFGIGVDKEKNDSLKITAGELSQLNGMTNVSWIWHTSYILSSLTGMVENNTIKVLSYSYKNHKKTVAKKSLLLFFLT